jgi:hypothetical protein
MQGDPKTEQLGNFADTSINKSIRRRVKVTSTTKGVKSWECTVDGEGYTEEEILAASDSLVKKLDEKYPAQVEAK